MSYNGTLPSDAEAEEALGPTLENKLVLGNSGMIFNNRKARRQKPPTDNKYTKKQNKRKK
jgi:hypothetical protein